MMTKQLKLITIMLTILTALSEAVVYEMSTVTGRYVRIDFPGYKRLRVGEIEVYSGGENVASLKPTSQSSIFSDIAKYQSSLGVDSNRSSSSGSSTLLETAPWYEVDLQGNYAIENMALFNGGRSIHGAIISVLDANRRTVYTQSLTVNEERYDFMSKNLGDIWVIGDQMMLGNNDGDGTSTPRSALVNALNEAGYHFTMTGHSTANAEGLSGATNTSHSAINGAEITPTTNALGTYWNQGRLAGTKPETIFIMLGSNEVNNTDIDGTEDRMEALLDKIYSLPGVGTPRIMIGGIPPNRSTPGFLGDATAKKPTDAIIHNERVRTMVQEYVQKHSRDVSYLDLYTILDENYATAIRADHFHVSGAGNALLGTEWVNTMEVALQDRRAPAANLAFPGSRSLLSVNNNYFIYNVTAPDPEGGTMSFSVITPPEGVTHSSGKKPWVWRNIFYASNTGQSITTDLTLLNEGYHVVNVYGSIPGHPSGNKQVKKVYDYLVNEHDFAPTFSASCMSRGAFMVFAFAYEYPELIEGIFMDNACGDALAWPAGAAHAGHVSYAPGKYYSGPGSTGSFDIHLAAYSEFNDYAGAVEFYKTQGSPIHQLQPLVDAGVPILSICGVNDHAVIIEENDYRIRDKFASLGGSVTTVTKDQIVGTYTSGYQNYGFVLVEEDKGHSHGPKTTANKNFLLDFIRHNTFRESTTTPVTNYTVNFNLAGGTRTGGGALSQTVRSGGAATAPTLTPPTGYRFTGWSTTFSSVVSNLNVTAQYAPVTTTSYTVNFNLAGGTRTGGGTLSQTVSEGGNAVAPTLTAPSGYTFSGWSTGFTNVRSNLTVTAQYSATPVTGGFTITNGVGRIVRIEIPTGSGSQKLYLNEVEVYVGGTNIAPNGTATQISNLSGSYGPENAIDQNQAGDAFHSSGTGFISNPWWEVDLGSVVNIEKIQITNIADNNAGRLNNFTLSILDASRNVVFSSANIPTAASFTFTQATTSSYTVNFDLSGGTRTGGGTLSQTVTAGGNAIAPTLSPPTGYTFSGWSTSFTNVRSNLTVTAQYAPVAAATYNVNFNLAGGTRTGGGALSQTVTEGENAIAPTLSAPSGYTFSGWSTSFTNVRSNLNVTAQYSATPVAGGFTITNGVGRIVRIEIPTGTRSQKLYLNEVEVYVGGTNIAPNGTATQSSDLSGSYGAENAIDGNEVGDAFPNSGTGFAPNPWWEVDLGSVVNIEQIHITNIVGNNAGRLDNFTLSILDASRNVVYSSSGIANAANFTFTQEGGNTIVNGVPKSWLTQHGIPATVAGTNDDVDGDGHSALQEYLAGTDPNSRESCLKMRGMRKQGNKIDLTWNSVSGKTYSIWHSTDLSSDSWTVVRTGVTGLQDATALEITEASGTNLRGFYRIEVE